MPQKRRQRLKFEDLDYEVFPDGRCRVEVRLEWQGEEFSAAVEGLNPLDGAYRTAAQATVEAAAAASDRTMDLELTGVKSIRAFDTLLVVAAVAATGNERRYKLIGVKATEEEEPVETAARAVLDALNRVLELYVPQRDGERDPGEEGEDAPAGGEPTG